MGQDTGALQKQYKNFTDPNALFGGNFGAHGSALGSGSFGTSGGFSPGGGFGAPSSISGGYSGPTGTGIGGTNAPQEPLQQPNMGQGGIGGTGAPQEPLQTPNGGVAPVGPNTGGGYGGGQIPNLPNMGGVSGNSIQSWLSQIFGGGGGAGLGAGPSKF